MIQSGKRAGSWIVLMVVGLMATAGCTAPQRQVSATPKNVIILIGDGMGPEHVKAGSFYAYGKEGALFMETLPAAARITTISAVPADSAPGKVHITDSAAAATALATGHKAYNGVLSMALPGDGQPYQTVLEAFAAKGRKTGLVTTAYITDATPAGFGAHTAKRGNGKEIIDCYLKTVRPDLILGGGYSKKEVTLTPEMVEAAGYQAVTNRTQLAAYKAAPGARVFGIFGESNMPYESEKAAAATQPDRAEILEMPSLTEMAEVALTTLSAEPKGFFLMVEGALIDKASHKNDLERVAPEVVELDNAVRAVMKWAAGRSDTLVIVTADHETGGLKVVRGRAQGQLPEVTWVGSDHTGANVPLYAWGVGATKVQGTMDNTDVYRLMMGKW